MSKICNNKGPDVQNLQQQQQWSRCPKLATTMVPMFEKVQQQRSRCPKFATTMVPMIEKVQQQRGQMNEKVQQGLITIGRRGFRVLGFRV